MGLKSMNLGGETKEETPVSFYQWAKQYPNIIFDSGINWGSVYFLTEEQKDVFIDWYRQTNPAPRYDVRQITGLIGDHLSNIIQIRQWLHNPDCYPGKKEKEYIAQTIRRAQETGKFTGIAPEAYPRILADLEKIPDTEDIVSYIIHYHY